MSPATPNCRRKKKKICAASSCERRSQRWNRARSNRELENESPTHLRTQASADLAQEGVAYSVRVHTVIFIYRTARKDTPRQAPERQSRGEGNRALRARRFHSNRSLPSDQKR